MLRAQQQLLIDLHLGLRLGANRFDATQEIESIVQLSVLVRLLSHVGRAVTSSWACLPADWASLV